MSDTDDEKAMMAPCPLCPDGSVWDTFGPTGKTCPKCKGYAVVHLNGAALTKEEATRHGY